MDKDFDYYESLPSPEISVRAKKRLNRLFRETVGSKKIPHPDVDNWFERSRSRVMRKIRVLKFNLTHKKR